jgi:hypothetical protein
MSSQSHDHSKHHHGGKGESRGRKLHKDWRVWALLLMLAAIVMYVLSLDDSVIPR